MQRALAAKNINHARAACIFAGYMKLMPLFIIVWPGMISRALYPGNITCNEKKKNISCKFVILTFLWPFVLELFQVPIIYLDEIACTDPEICSAVCDNSVGCSNVAYPKLVQELLPPGRKKFQCSKFKKKNLTSKYDDKSQAQSIKNVDTPNSARWSMK